MLMMELQQRKIDIRVSGRQRESEAEKMLKAEPDLEGAHDFAARLPRLLHNHLTGGGVYRSRNLRIFPGSWNGMGEVPEHGGLIYMGHHLTFDAIVGERAIITSSTFYRDAPVSNPNRKFLAERLEDPSKCGDPKYWQGRDISRFGNGELIKAEAITVKLPAAGGPIIGPAKPFFDSYVYHVAKPLTSVFWR